MMLKLKPSILLIILSVLFYSCQKEYSLEGNVAAVYSLTGSPGACTNAVVTGTYQAGTALGATNIVTIAVDVTAIGTYTISTGPVNGIIFSGSGSFTATGPQTILLNGTGIPVAAGTFSFTTGVNGCSFPVIVSSGGGSSGGTAVFTLNGAPGNCTGFSTAGTYAAGTALGATNTATVTVNVATIGTYTISTNTVNGISFAGSGSFTTTGPQPVQLIGSGTPLAGGTFDFIPGTNGCTFSLLITGSSSGSAVFTYTGAPGTCTSATPAGTYTAGIALTASNTVVVGVNVTTIGTYILSTPIVNGFSFSGSGSFTATGPQIVTLTGSGTPGASGIFNFTPSNNGCSFPVTVAAGTLTDFLICTIDGVPKTFNVDLLGDRFTADTIDIGGAESSAGNSPLFGIELSKSPAITTGIYNRYSFTNTSTFCTAGYDDGLTTTLWFSALLLQTGGFTVNVTLFTANRISGTFSGTLYDNVGLGTGTKTVTAGSFSVPY
ncbi:MAG: hypothetical protein H7Z13_21145 [Ferruginibacter sp.]|nr:hypothetical protein [Ferruginibacter sp.]